MKYLALGDSYTIGELVSYEDNFPSQTCKMLQAAGHPLSLDKLIAVTGWTTDELNAAIAKEKPGFDYDWVSLLIGVNNQYRGRSLDEYSWQFYALLSQAILFAKGNVKRVVVLSIPDWGLTPFNKKRDKKDTSELIDAFNAENKKWSAHFGCHYIDITESTRVHAQDEDYLTSDGLHLSPKEYEIWANKLSQLILKNS